VKNRIKNLVSRSAGEQHMDRGEDTENDEIVSALEGVQLDVAKLRKHIGTDDSIPRSVRLNLDTLRLLAVEPIYSDLRSFMSEHCLDFSSTMRRLARQDTSFARFGDGEFKVMLRADGNHKFQDVVPGIQSDLRAVMANDLGDRMLVGLPHLFNNPFWSNIWANYYPQLRPMFSTATSYACAHVTRPVYFQIWRGEAVTSWRKVWDGMKAVVVTGQEAKFDLVPELFDNLDGAEFVRGPNSNAYTELDRLEQGATAVEADVVLISLGPSGTILAHRLASKGVLALDIGHISASYKNVFAGASRPEEL
jgi:hypothetical protein